MNKRSDGERQAITSFIQVNREMTAKELAEKINGGCIKNLSSDVNVAYVNYIRYQKKNGMGLPKEPEDMQEEEDRETEEDDELEAPAKKKRKYTRRAKPAAEPTKVLEVKAKDIKSIAALKLIRAEIDTAIKVLEWLEKQ